MMPGFHVFVAVVLATTFSSVVFIDAASVKFAPKEIFADQFTAGAGSPVAKNPLFCGIHCSSLGDTVCNAFKVDGTSCEWGLYDDTVAEGGAQSTYKVIYVPPV